jgi:hypothetical protein
MWPPPKVITLEILFQAWKDQVEITKAMKLVEELGDLSEFGYFDDSE